MSDVGTAGITSTEQELCELTQITANNGENRQQFLERLLAAVNELPDNTWKHLSTAAKEWSNAATTAKDNKEEIEEFPEDLAEESNLENTSESETPETVEENSEVRTAVDNVEVNVPATNSKRGRKPGKAKVAKAKKVKVVKAKKVKVAKAPKTTTPKERKTRGDSARDFIKNLVIKQPSITVDAIMERLAKSGLKATLGSVKSIRFQCRNTIALMNKAGKSDIALD